MDNTQIVKTAAEELFEKVGIQATFEASNDENGVQLAVTTEENALLIGKHGNTLSSLESILGLIASQQIGEFQRVIIEVGGYREDREHYLLELADRLREEVLAQGGEKTIRGLKPWERRLVHMHFSENDDVMTESTGEDRDRVLVIKKKA